MWVLFGRFEMTGVMAVSLLEKCAHKQLDHLKAKNGCLRQLDSDDESNSSSDERHDLSKAKEKGRESITLNDMARMAHNGGLVDTSEYAGLPFTMIGWIFGTVTKQIPELLQFRKDNRPRPRPAKDHKDRKRAASCRSAQDCLRGRTQLSILMETLFVAISKTQNRAKSPLQLCIHMMEHADRVSRPSSRCSSAQPSPVSSRPTSPSPPSQRLSSSGNVLVVPPALRPVSCRLQSSVRKSCANHSVKSLCNDSFDR